MEKIFLDTNFVIDLAYRDPEKRATLDGKFVYISTLSIHILCYIKHLTVPDKHLEEFIDQFYVENFSENVLGFALHGPTNDLEDNIQLQSALKANCDYFLTEDKKLLKLGSIGKVRIINSL